MLRSGATLNENEPSGAVVVLATAATALNGYGLAYNSTGAPAGAPDGAVPDSVDGRPLAIDEGRAVKLTGEIPGAPSEAASAPAGTARTAATTIAAAPLRQTPKLLWTEPLRGAGGGRVRENSGRRRGN